MLNKGFTPVQILKASLSAICKLRTKDSNRSIGSHKKFVMGFTLLELLMVVIIIGVLSSIALPQYTATIEKARSGEAMINVSSTRQALDRYWYQNGRLPPDNNFSALDIDNPNSVTNRLYDYSFKDNGTTSLKRNYKITATRLGALNTWVSWNQTDNFTGKLIRSENLGGPSN